MEIKNLENELNSLAYHGRGIIIGKSADSKKAITAYFIMGRSENSRNRVFVEDGAGIRTQAFDPAKLVDPSLIIYPFNKIIYLIYPSFFVKQKRRGDRVSGGWYYSLITVLLSTTSTFPSQKS